jgi:hypothetical protein
MLNENVHSEFTAYSERTSIIDASGDANNNFNVDYTIDADDEEKNERGLLKKLFKSSKFKNIQIEMLYQRYLLRMNQNNAAHIVWLLFALIFILAIIHGRFFITRWNEELKCGNKSVVNATEFNFLNITDLFDANFTVENSTDGCESSGQNSYELLGTNLIQFSLLGLCSILYTILLLCLSKRINEIYLFHVSYAIIISLVIIDISFSITNQANKAR